MLALMYLEPDTFLNLPQLLMEVTLEETFPNTNIEVVHSHEDLHFPLQEFPCLQSEPLPQHSLLESEE